MRVTRLRSISDEEQKPVSSSLRHSLQRDLHSKCLFLTALISASLSAVIWCKLSVSVHRPGVPPPPPQSLPTVTPSLTTTTSRTSSSTQHPVWPCDGSYIYIPASLLVMLYLVYLVECWHCHTRLDLRCRADINTVYQRIASLRHSPPVVWWKIVCYHYVRRSRHVTRYRNGDAYTAAHAYYERVNSQSVTSAFNYSTVGVVDRSKRLVDLEKYPATRIYLTKGFSFASVEAERQFVEQRSAFFQDYHRRDDYLEFREGIDLINVTFRREMTAFSSADRFPWYVSKVSFWLASVLLLSWPLRVFIQYKTAVVHYHIHKVFGHEGGLDSGGDIGTDQQMALTRTSTMENYDLEKTILRNNSLVPSYSEAMLMEVDGMHHPLQAAPNLLPDPPWGQRPGPRGAVRASASSNLLGGGGAAAWRGAHGHVRRMWCTGTGSFESSLTHALPLPPPPAQGGRRKERLREKRTNTGKKSGGGNGDLRNENDLEMTSLVSTTSTTATTTATKDTGARAKTMQEPSTSSVTQPRDTSFHPTSSPITPSTVTTSTSSSSSYSSSSTSSSISSTESLPSYDTALNMAAIADTQCLITTGRNSARTNVCNTLVAVTTARSPRKRRPVARDDDDDSRDDVDSVETASTYVDDQMETPRHQPSSVSTIVPSRIQCRIVEDRETSL